MITAAHCIADHVSGGRDCVDLNFGQLKVVLGESDLKKVEGHEIYKGTYVYCFPVFMVFSRLIQSCN